MIDLQSEQAAKGNYQIARVPGGHAPTKAEQQTLNGHHAQSLPEQKVAHPEGQHRTQAVANKL